MKKVGKERINWPVTILLIAGVITVIFPLYMTVVIALKKPSEMTNDIAGILSLPKHFSLSNFAEAESNGFLEFTGKQPADHDRDGSVCHSDSTHAWICNCTK